MDRHGNQNFLLVISMTALTDFDLLKRLGKGGFGVVRQARRKSDGKIVCIKRISLENSQQLPKLQRESLMLSSLHSPYIIQYESSFSDLDAHYIVMEHATGGSLQDLISVCSLVFVSS